MSDSKWIDAGNGTFWQVPEPAPPKRYTMVEQVAAALAFIRYRFDR